MADINSELQALKDAVTAETDQDAALAVAIDGAVSTMASGVAEIKALAQQIGTVANDPEMVRGLAAQLKAATDTQASKLAALQAASGDLASAVVAGTQGGTSTGGSGSTSGSSDSSTSNASGDSGSPATSPSTDSASSSGTSGTSTADVGPLGPLTSDVGVESPPSVTTDTSTPVETTATSTDTADTGPTLDPSGE